MTTNKSPAPRMYSNIWKLLKSKEEVVIEADPRGHARIKKAVIKEKWMDLGFRMSQMDANTGPKLVFERVSGYPNKLRIKLVPTKLGGL